MDLHEEIFQISQSIWLSILNLSIIPGDDLAAKMAASTERSLTGCIHLTGDWEGAVLLYCKASFARKAATIMFAAEGETMTTEDTQDALGELTNMTAGNIKPLLPGASKLSLPSVVEGLDYSLIVPGSTILTQCGFESDDEAIIVTLVKKRKREIRPMIRV